jgi:D-alanyl-D-alanine carboxypeptidase (penicillin-binding protein 5/6)
MKSRRRRLLPASLIGVVILLICGYSVAHFTEEKKMSLVEMIPSKTSLAKDVQLAWPEVGQAAVGSVEDGLLASSSHNEEVRPTASMAKVITALAIMKKQPFDLGQTGETYTLTYRDVANYEAAAAKGGSVVPVYEGMELTQYKAMQAMLIASGNNIAETLVQKIFGSEKAYTAYAEDMLKDMGLSRTAVADASGFSSSTVSTPSELVLIGIAALKDPVIANIVAQPQAQIPGVGTIKNTNELLGVSGVVGIKTGTTEDAGSCLLFAGRYEAENGQEVTIVGVIMGDTNAASLFNNSQKLLESTSQAKLFY